MTLSLVSRSLPSEWAKDNTSYNQFFLTSLQHYYTDNKRQPCTVYIHNNIIWSTYIKLMSPLPCVTLNRTIINPIYFILSTTL